MRREINKFLNSIDPGGRRTKRIFNPTPGIENITKKLRKYLPSAYVCVSSRYTNNADLGEFRLYVFVNSIKHKHYIGTNGALLYRYIIIYYKEPFLVENK